MRRCRASRGRVEPPGQGRRSRLTCPAAPQSKLQLQAPQTQKRGGKKGRHMNTAHLFQGWGGWLLAEVEESGGKEVGAIRVFIYLFMFFF